MKRDSLKAFEDLVGRLAPGSRGLRAWELEGGVSARTVAVEFMRPDGLSEKAVVRLHGEVDRASNPNIAADEFRLLEVVNAAGIPAPAPLYLDTSCELFEIPYLVVAFVEGTTEVDSVDVSRTVEAMAKQLADIHGADWSVVDLRFLPAEDESVSRRLRMRPMELDESLSENRIRAALGAHWPLTSTNPRVLLHGDYWPGNILWRDGEIAAVIDWEDAALGDPLADLGNCRLELLWAYGEEAMDAFTERYRSLMPSLDYTNLPQWDLYAALHPAGKLSTWRLDAETEARMVAAHRRFVDQALNRLGDKST